ncbi:beta-glucuronidase-like [Schistocerca cancellata]|uniref:beta-glucuronidase-like n=1 Tax=Schistocerca cancellata TaxID=274614 RepID=UPI0021175132|nr:beta-glucuronidase-like [Schistocerca cancellata]
MPAWVVAAVSAVRAAMSGMWRFCLLLTTAAVAPVAKSGVLYPRESESREVRPLDGLWNFKLDADEVGYTEAWFNDDLTKTGGVLTMPVPASYNDVTTLKEVRDHVGLVWYDRSFFVPRSWERSDTRVWLRFGSVCYSAEVWLNGYRVMEHDIGHLPFQSEITSLLNFGASNRITVAVNNILTNTTIPQGAFETLRTENGSRTYQTYTFDFFNYAGIDRSVHLYTTPEVFIDDITITTEYSDDGTGTVYYNVTFDGQSAELPSCSVSLLDAEGLSVATSTGFTGELIVTNANPWWPYLMHPNPGYLYILEVHVNSSEMATDDVYRLPVGIRQLSWDNSSLLINGKPIYIRGFGRHEDSDIRGKGLDLPLVTRDHDLLKWVGANSYRTSHYPYAEEIMDFADKEGFIIIDECPAVNIENYSGELLENHKRSLTELINRDKNRPSAIIWSVANEPRTYLNGTEDYYREIIDHVKSLDTTRPTTIAQAQAWNRDRSSQYLDIIGVNRYLGWYENGGLTETIVEQLLVEISLWRAKYNKPIIITEYGADAMEGLHLQPSYIWSEEYQEALFSEYFKAFDRLREKGYFVGEMIWNFADFKTAQTYTRVGGNKKGIFTRSRQPKMAANLVRQRYWSLAREDDNVTVPADLTPYVCSTCQK